MLFNDILKLIEDVDHCWAYAYADDLVLLLDGGDHLKLQDRVNSTLDLVANWGVRKGLHFNPNKTQCMQFGKLKSEMMLRMNDTQLSFVNELCYLGIIFDPKLKWNAHIKFACSKARKRLAMAKRIAAHTWGLSAEIRMKIYNSVLVSTGLYSAPVWADGLSRDCRRKPVRSLQREALLWACCLFKTTSETQVGILADVPPLYLLAEESKQRYHCKRFGGCSWLNSEILMNCTTPRSVTTIAGFPPLLQSKVKPALRGKLTEMGIGCQPSRH